MARRIPHDVSIGKFDILATYTYAKGLLDGLVDAETNERAMVAAIMGAKVRLGQRGGTTRDDHEADKRAAEKKRKSTITAESFDRQVSGKMGRFFDDVFLPAIKKFVEEWLSYDEVERLLQDPEHLWGED